MFEIGRRDCHQWISGDLARNTFDLFEKSRNLGVVMKRWTSMMTVETIDLNFCQHRFKTVQDHQEKSKSSSAVQGITGPRTSSFTAYQQGAEFCTHLKLLSGQWAWGSGSLHYYTYF